MTEKRPNPARDGFRRAMEETDWSRGFFGDGVSLALHAAKSGDMESLAKMLEDGAALDPAERKFAADALRGVARVSRRKALLHKSREDQGSPIPGQTYPMASVTGMPSAVKPFMTATRTWNSAT